MTLAAGNALGGRQRPWRRAPPWRPATTLVMAGRDPAICARSIGSICARSAWEDGQINPALTQQPRQPGSPASRSLVSERAGGHRCGHYAWLRYRMERSVHRRADAESQHAASVIVVPCRIGAWASCRTPHGARWQLGDTGETVPLDMGCHRRKTSEPVRPAVSTRVTRCNWCWLGGSDRATLQVGAARSDASKRLTQMQPDGRRCTRIGHGPTRRSCSSGSAGFSRAAPCRTRAHPRASAFIPSASA